MVRGAAVEQAADGPIAARADDQQVQLAAERGQLLAGVAVGGVALDSVEIGEVMQLVGDQLTRDLRPLNGERMRGQTKTPARGLREPMAAGRTAPFCRSSIRSLW